MNNGKPHENRTIVFLLHSSILRLSLVPKALNVLSELLTSERTIDEKVIMTEDVRCYQGQLAN